MAKKRWDESQVTRDENGRFVAQGYTQIPQMGGQGSNPAYQRQIQGHQRRLQMLQQMNGPQIQQQHIDMRQRQLNTLRGMTSSTRRRKGSSGLA
jgi:hypothetical protein